MLLAALVVCSVRAAFGQGLLTFDADLSGPAESPPNASPGTGFAQAIFDDNTQTLQIEVQFSGLLGTTTASHIHAATTSPGAGTAGVATTTPYFVGFPLGVTSGSYSNTLDLTASSSYNSSYITAHGGTTAGAETALISAMESGTAYLNIHTTVVPGGEIRGFFTQVPEPGTVSLVMVGALVLAWRTRRERPNTERATASN